MLHILEGSLRYKHGSETFLLKPGDTLTFRGEVPHGPEKLLKTPIRMLSIIIYGGSDSPE
jgi:mannose-6-phosphate isomerase-like protein (cupin superfamily)